MEGGKKERKKRYESCHSNDKTNEHEWFFFRPDEGERYMRHNMTWTWVCVRRALCVDGVRDYELMKWHGIKWNKKKRRKKTSILDETNNKWGEHIKQEQKGDKVSTLGGFETFTGFALCANKTATLTKCQRRRPSCEHIKLPSSAWLLLSQQNRAKEHKPLFATQSAAVGWCFAQVLIRSSSVRSQESSGRIFFGIFVQWFLWRESLVIWVVTKTRPHTRGKKKREKNDKV